MVGLRGPALVIDENVNLKTRCFSERIKSEYMSGWTARGIAEVIE